MLRIGGWPSGDWTGRRIPEWNSSEDLILTLVLGWLQECQPSEDSGEPLGRTLLENTQPVEKAYNSPLIYKACSKTTQVGSSWCSGGLTGHSDKKKPGVKNVMAALVRACCFSYQRAMQYLPDYVAKTATLNLIKGAALSHTVMLSFLLSLIRRPCN